MSKNISYSGILLAINIILLILCNIIPTNTMFFMILASLPVSVVIMEFGIKSGVVFCIASAILSFMVFVNKFEWLLYFTTFCVYGILKYLIEKDRNVFLEYFLKILYANSSVGVLYFLLKDLIFIPMNVFIVLAFQVLFLIYDYIYSYFIDYYNLKFRKILK